MDDEVLTATRMAAAAQHATRTGRVGAQLAAGRARQASQEILAPPAVTVQWSQAERPLGDIIDEAARSLEAERANRAREQALQADAQAAQERARRITQQGEVVSARDAQADVRAAEESLWLARALSDAVADLEAALGADDAAVRCASITALHALIDSLSSDAAASASVNPGRLMGDFMRECGAIELVTEYLSEDSAEVRQRALMVINPLLSDALDPAAAQSRQVFVWTNPVSGRSGLDVLLPMLDSDDWVTQMLAVSCCQNLAEDVTVARMLQAPDRPRDSKLRLTGRPRHAITAGTTHRSAARWRYSSGCCAARRSAWRRRALSSCVFDVCLCITAAPVHACSRIHVLCARVARSSPQVRCGTQERAHRGETAPPRCPAGAGAGRRPATAGPRPTAGRRWWRGRRRRSWQVRCSVAWRRRLTTPCWLGCCWISTLGLMMAHPMPPRRRPRRPVGGSCSSSP